MGLKKIERKKPYIHGIVFFIYQSFLNLNYYPPPSEFVVIGISFCTREDKMCYYLSMCSILRKHFIYQKPEIIWNRIHIFFPHSYLPIHIYVHYSNLTMEKIEIKNVGPPVSHFSQAVYEQIKISIMSNKVC